MFSFIVPDVTEINSTSLQQAPELVNRYQSGLQTIHRLLWCINQVKMLHRRWNFDNYDVNRLLKSAEVQHYFAKDTSPATATTVLTHCRELSGLDKCRVVRRYNGNFPYIHRHLDGSTVRMIIPCQVYDIHRIDSLCDQIANRREHVMNSTLMTPLKVTKTDSISWGWRSNQPDSICGLQYAGVCEDYDQLTSVFNYFIVNELIQSLVLFGGLSCTGERLISQATHYAALPKNASSHQPESDVEGAIMMHGTMVSDWIRELYPMSSLEPNPHDTSYQLAHDIMHRYSSLFNLPIDMFMGNALGWLSQVTKDRPDLHPAPSTPTDDKPTDTSASSILNLAS